MAITFPYRGQGQTGYFYYSAPTFDASRISSSIAMTTSGSTLYPTAASTAAHVEFKHFGYEDLKIWSKVYFKNDVTFSSDGGRFYGMSTENGFTYGNYSGPFALNGLSDPNKTRIYVLGFYYGAYDLDPFEGYIYTHFTSKKNGSNTDMTVEMEFRNMSDSIVYTFSRSRTINFLYTSLRPSFAAAWVSTIAYKEFELQKLYVTTQNSIAGVIDTPCEGESFGNPTLEATINNDIVTMTVGNCYTEGVSSIKWYLPYGQTSTDITTINRFPIGETEISCKGIYEGVPFSFSDIITIESNKIYDIQNKQVAQFL